MRKGVLFFLPAFAVLAGCVSAINFTAPLEGRFDRAGVVNKSFVVIGAVSVSSTETHRVGPLGLKRTVEGSKITYSDLMIEAARLDADDIIDVRIDMNTAGRVSFLDWLKGWERTFTHSGQALAVIYVNGEEEASEEEPLEDADSPIVF